MNIATGAHPTLSSTLRQAIASDDPKAVSLALAAGADPAAPILVGIGDPWAMGSPACFALNLSSLAAFQALLPSLAPHDLAWAPCPASSSSDTLLRSPMGLAILRSQPQAAALLAQAGDAQAMMHPPWTPLEYAALHDEPAVIEALLPWVERPKDATPLARAAAYASPACVELLLSVCDPMERCGTLGRSALMAACAGNSACRLANVELLLPLSDLQARDAEGMTALDIAQDAQAFDVAALLERAALDGACPQSAARRRPARF